MTDYQGGWKAGYEAASRDYREENERLNRDLEEQNLRVQDLQARLSAAEEEREDLAQTVRVQGQVVADLREEEDKLREENESLRVAFEEELECCKQRGEENERLKYEVTASERISEFHDLQSRLSAAQRDLQNYRVRAYADKQENERLKDVADSLTMYGEGGPAWFKRLQTLRTQYDDLQARLSTAEERERHWIGKYNEACVVIDTVRGELLTESSMRTMQGDGERREREILQSRLSAAETERDRLRAEHASIADVGMVPAVRYDEVVAERDMLRGRLEHELQLRAESDAVALKYQDRLSEAVRLGTKNGLENEKLREQLSAAEERAEYERARAGARAEKAADLQSRLSAAEERITVLDQEAEGLSYQVLVEQQRAEAVVEAAKRHVDTSGGSPHGDLDVAVRRYEEHRA